MRNPWEKEAPDDVENSHDGVLTINIEADDGISSFMDGSVSAICYLNGV